MVWHRDGQRSGKVLECEGGRVFIEQENGAELDFPERDLTASPPASARPAGTPAASAGRGGGAAAYVMPEHILITADITPEHVRVLGLVPQRTLQAVAALYERRPGRRKFSALDVAGKLNVITEITAVPYRTMRDYSDRPGELGLLMGKGLADSQKAAG
ncbi:hypothetical protein [Falsiroseomonas selenitidurans]|uniref:Hedgehog/Intein (Hint) domain-containing protein n=1 Tax=Falsiroseomonas selenitidurans TaxID=2716335 RepID=A0ABX1E4Y7_9PROT|nr:hypothetical protein [Falsiroseomonas selenitidurans]NKC32156.1 hypothetical protein [Falsiroseomonas selenitidurans]